MLQINDRLQINKERPLTGVAAQNPESLAELLASFVGFVKRQFAVILSVSLVPAALGAIYLLSAPAWYTGWASLMIDTDKLQIFRQQSVFADRPIDASAVDSQVEVLKSENIALAVVKKLNLADDPEFVQNDGGALRRLTPNSSGSEESRSLSVPTRQAVAALQSRLIAKRVGLTYVIDIGVASLNPERAAQLANAVAEAYIEDQLAAKYQATRRAAMWLQDRLQELRGQASVAERAVVDFKAKNNIIDTGGRLMNEQQLAELSSALVQARAQTAEAKARLDRVSQILAKDDPDPANSETATVADSLHNEVITKLRMQYLELANREADWARRYGATHLAAVDLRNQMVEIRRSVVDELRRIAETYKSDYAIAKSRQSSIEESLTAIVSQSETTNQAQIQLRELESASQTYRALYDSFLQRYMDSVQQQSYPVTEARLITTAGPPVGKSSPKRLLVLVITASAGMLLGFGAGMLRELSDQVFRTRNHVENNLAVSCLAILPLIKASAKRSAAKTAPGAKKPSKAPEPLTLVRDRSPLWYASEAPFSRFAEAVRAIKIAADLARVRGQNENKVFAVTSALPNEGKSTAAACFAQVIAQGGSRVVLVDCDLRNPSLSRSVTPNAHTGLIEVVSGQASPGEALWTARHNGNLKFLPAVLRTPLSNSSEVLASEATKKLFTYLRGAFDYVVVDLPPLAPVVDTRATIQLIDSYVFVIEWGRTKIGVVKQALANAAEIHDNLLGVVLNKADVNVLGRYEDSVGRYYEGYFARYGQTN